MVKECENEKENALSAYRLAALKLLHSQLCVSVQETANSNAPRCCEDRPVFNRDLVITWLGRSCEITAIVLLTLVAHFVFTVADPWGINWGVNWV